VWNPILEERPQHIVEKYGANRNDLVCIVELPPEGAKSEESSARQGVSRDAAVTLPRPNKIPQPQSGLHRVEPWSQRLFRLQEIVRTVTLLWILSPLRVELSGSGVMKEATSLEKNACATSCCFAILLA
jgi:hypothetical protein